MQSLAETVKKYPSYADASKAACAWVEKGKVKVDPSKLEIYTSKVGPYKGCVVGKNRLSSGVGLKRKSALEDIVRIDNDNTGKGIHFNAKNESDTSQKLAAVLQKTVSMSAKDRDVLYGQYLKALENLSADTIWDWWRTGHKPTHVEDPEDQLEDM
ncbi:hypothetical protein WOLCODRAFT_164043 [Wolfiporia cocos MD-104 SS10]|uniref:Uncharacterized protein n=1 Tax=Wolfiporia cocos (strain MD-104) TaxID=742152 RepID=A0A2H3JY82_WOLCO|nr:hypothetical protein WOLCODRAFT_164043 [Wolfiporia cocos MD-104 SS10]